MSGPGRRLIGAASRVKLRLQGTGFPPVAEAAGPLPLFVGPLNSAGQGFEWARAAESAKSGIHATSMAFIRHDDAFAFEVDQPVHLGYATHSRRWQRMQLAALGDFHSALIESAAPPLAGLFGGDSLAQLTEISNRGVRLALLFHGSDIRDPDRHLAEQPDSHFAVDPDLTQSLRDVTARNRELMSVLDTQIFVSTPDLLDEVPGASWLPVVIDPTRWAARQPALETSKPLRVVHVPSSSLIKGAELVAPVLEELQSSGRIEYRSVHGVKHEFMPSTYGSADVVLDQFRVGSYGVAACEALAAGRLVVSHVSQAVRRRVLESTGSELPIVQATASTLADVLADIDERRDHYAVIAARGPEFVNRHHGRATSGRAIAEWMEPR